MCLYVENNSISVFLCLDFLQNYKATLFHLLSLCDLYSTNVITHLTISKLKLQNNQIKQSNTQSRLNIADIKINQLQWHTVKGIPPPRTNSPLKTSQAKLKCTHIVITPVNMRELHVLLHCKLVKILITLKCENLPLFQIHFKIELKLRIVVFVWSCWQTNQQTNRPMSI